MQPYILTRRNAIHIIDPKETLKGILAAKRFLARIVGEGRDVLFVGTKRQARKAIEEKARKVGMHYVTGRWLGGTLTNFRTIRSRLGRLEKLEQLEADGQLQKQSKKEASRLRREMRKIKRNLEGIRHMEQLCGAVFVVDARREVIALREARKVGVPTIALIDTDSDPDLVDIPIPGNDDATRGIELIAEELCQAIELGRVRRTDKAEAETKPKPARRRSRRDVMGRAEDAKDAAAEADTPAVPTAPTAPTADAAPPAPAAPAAPPAVAPATSIAPKPTGAPDADDKPEGQGATAP